MENNLTFEDVINSDWVSEVPYGGDGFGVSVRSGSGDGDYGVLYIMPMDWDEFLPLTYNLRGDEDALALYGLMYYSKDMFKLLRDIDDDRARELVDKIINNKIYPKED